MISSIPSWGCCLKKILVVVPDGCDEMEVAPFIEMPGWTKVVEGVERVDVVVAGWDDPICMFHGLKVVPDIKVSDVNTDEYDAVFLPGGWNGTRYFEQVNGEQMRSIFRRMHDAGKIIATACNGIIAVGEAGLLPGRKVTSFTGDCCEFCRGIKDRLRRYGADFQEKAIVRDGRILSNIGPAVADEDALRLMELLIGKEAVSRIAEMMMYRTVRPEELRWTFPTGEGWPHYEGRGNPPPIRAVCTRETACEHARRIRTEE
jgi:4-methyl-5(b-hydroxyethyl)-thiazole monophosphate biosynthesis